MLLRVRETYERYERYISSVALIGGFVLDNLTLRRIDLFFENLVFLIYLGVAALSITFLSLAEARAIGERWSSRFHTVMLLLLQFALGGLFSGFFIFYSRSGSLSASWPFLLLLLGLLIGNEVFKSRYAKFIFRMSVFFVVLFSFAIFYIPILVGDLSPRSFMLSGVASLGAMALFSYALFAGLPTLRVHMKWLGWSIGAIYVLITIMYFTNILPPIPLSLKNAGVYHDVRRSGDAYVASREPQPWYRFFERYENIHPPAGGQVYAFSAIFAPTKINTTIVHEWQYHDPKDDWVTVSRIPFSIAGGRDGGYRGYTLKNNMNPGKWRVNIKTQRGQLIGRIKFEIVPGELTKPLESIIL